MQWGMTVGADRSDAVGWVVTDRVVSLTVAGNSLLVDPAWNGRLSRSVIEDF